MSTLTELANYYRSDKGTVWQCAHGYTRIYETLLEPAREAAIHLAEIGLMHGVHQKEFQGKETEIGCPSLNMWADYLPWASVYGFDCIDFQYLSKGRIRIHHGDQGSCEDLKAFAAMAENEFDVIIDDGSHISWHQQTTLITLFQYLSPGGIYVIEDLHYQPPGTEQNGVPRTLDFLRELRCGGGDTSAIKREEIIELQSEIEQIYFFDSLSPRWPLESAENALAVLVRKGKHPNFVVDCRLSDLI